MTVTDTYRQTDYTTAANRYRDVLLPQAQEMILRTPGRRFKGTCTEFVNEVHRMAGITVNQDFTDSIASALVPAIKNMGERFELAVVDHGFVDDSGVPQDSLFHADTQHVIDIRWQYRSQS